MIRAEKEHITPAAHTDETLAKLEIKFQTKITEIETAAQKRITDLEIILEQKTLQTEQMTSDPNIFWYNEQSIKVIIRWSSCSSYCKDVWVYQEERCSCCKHFLSTIIGAYHLFKLTTITFSKVLGDVINFTLPFTSWWYRTHGGYWWFGLLMRPNGTCMGFAKRVTTSATETWLRMLIDATHQLLLWWETDTTQVWYHSYPPLSLLGVVISISTTFSDWV